MSKIKKINIDFKNISKINKSKSCEDVRKK